MSLKREELSTETTLDASHVRPVPQPKTADSRLRSMEQGVHELTQQFNQMEFDRVSTTPEYDRRFEAMMMYPSRVPLVVSPLDFPPRLSPGPIRVHSPSHEWPVAMDPRGYEALMEHYIYPPMYRVYPSDMDGYRQREICRFYLQGKCQKGDRCQYAHSSPYTPNISPGNTMYASSPESTPNSAQTQSSTQSGGGYKSRASPTSEASRKTRQSEEAARYTNLDMETVIGQLYSLCKDQHGCRYLQRQLDENNNRWREAIFEEIAPHFVELMTDPFGNYLCQKMLEVATDQQRSNILDTVAPELVNISLNMHGTRSAQKLIDCLSTKEQIENLTLALSPHVVTLVQDLHGNHVIQKCLNKLTHEQNQFIYTNVVKECVEVATHRHGCCVLQRCIDHASESQKHQIVNEVTRHALALVQDPFGNYVVQYVLELQDKSFSDALIRRFLGNVCLLSVQKFSSNVMEKAIRTADAELRHTLVEELLSKDRLDKLLRDSYANYVVQTALDYADPKQRQELVDCIMPLLPAIRNTPYGKRIENKLRREELASHGLSRQSPAPRFNPPVVLPLFASMPTQGYPGNMYM